MFLIQMFHKFLKFLFSIFPKKKDVIYVPPPLKISSYNLVINNTLYGGANVVPIAVLHFCFIIKSKNTVLKSNLSKFYLCEVVTSFSCLNLVIYLEQTHPHHVECRDIRQQHFST